jgi:hypothetical protein
MGDWGSGWYGQIYGDKARQREALNAQEDMMDEQFAQMQSMFPFVNMISDQATNFYGNQWDKIEDYLRHPTPPSNLERQLFEFFGGTVPEKGYYRTGGGKKGGPGALTNRLLGRYGAGESGPLAGQGQVFLDEATDYLRSLIPYAEDWAETGFKTDIQPIQDYAMRMFEREMMPTTVERFGPNITGSGFQHAMGELMGDVSSKLGAMEVGLSEAAADRRMQGLTGPIQNIFTGPMNLATAFATAAAQAGQNYMNRVDQARPGAALLGSLPMFANVDAMQGSIQGGFPTSGTDWGNVGSAWGQVAGNIGSNVGNILGQLPWEDWFGGDDFTYQQWDMGGTDLFDYEGDPMEGMDWGGSGGEVSSIGEMGSIYA